jgi:hypothetical protein
MLSKCANPSCSAAFRYLHEGVVFHVAVGWVAQERVRFQGIPKIERFWLCGECSTRMAVMAHPPGALVVPLEQMSESQKQRNRSQLWIQQ